MQRTTFTADLRRAASGVLTTALMAAGAVALAPSAQAATGQTGQQAATEQRPAATNGTKAAQGAAAARSTQVTLGNYTGHGLTKTWEKLDHGCWTKDMLPPDYIPNGRVPSWASESCGFATGTEGRAVYAIAGGGEISLHWNNPYVGSNSYSCFVPDGYTCSRTGGSGDNAQVRFDVRPKSQLTQARTTAAVPGATAARSTTVSLTNNSGTLLTRAGSNLHWGVWSDGLLPPSMVQPGVTAKWGSESEGLMTGTEGEVTFDVAGSSNRLRVYWNNPYWGSNSYSCSAPAGYKCTQQGGTGDNAAVSFTLSRA
ncbi:aegerolysin family protein [Streptomyces sudanensis]|uniref:aegerolysin family protein n=1 Tax=Streptomyces sudanensis TaxID=436397 RepID=UPI0020CE5BFD|nr:aegerolysin family protein [Streptomyces sudanensis]MCP9956601.1 aegerolysin family protein [Streptomyces sudanensis]MCP9985803.1 aegerolysin family protein [Streptomyces sudanensis]MCQ0002794.1 aegerolysin family protein [Streptomyces sudanensis]